MANTKVNDSKFLSLTGLTKFWNGAKLYIDNLGKTKLSKDATVNEQKFEGNAVTIGAEHITVGGAGAFSTNNVQEALVSLNSSVEAATKAGVTKFGNKTGEITLKAEDADTNGAVNLKMSNNELQASIVGLKDAAYQPASHFALASHTHEMSEVTGLEDALSTKVDNTITVNGQQLNQNITLDGTNINTGSAGTYKGTIKEAIEGLDAAIKAEEVKTYVDTFGGENGAIELSAPTGDNTIKLSMSGKTLQAELNKITTSKIDGLDTKLSNKTETSVALKEVKGSAAATADNVTITLISNHADNSKHANESIVLPVAEDEKQGTVTLNKVRSLAAAAATSTYKVKGSKTDFSELTESDNTEGDVWNITNAFDMGEGEEKKHYPAGTNVVWVGLQGGVAAHWDALGGTVDLTPYATTTAVKQDVDRIDNELALKAVKSEVDDALALKAVKSEVDDALAKKADKETVTADLALKADKETVTADLAKKADKTALESTDGKVKAIEDNYISSFGGKAGKAKAITVRGGLTGASAAEVNLAMEGDQLQASIVGLKNGATTEFAEITTEQLRGLDGLADLIPAEA